VEPREYETMFRVEDVHWWYVGLRELVFSYIKAYAADKEGLKLLDAGCGTGALLARCEGFEAKGFDYSEHALEFCRKRGLHNVVKGYITDIPFDDGSFDIAVSLDVLYHAGVENDTDALKELWRVLARGGILIVNLPAYEALRSTHDEAIHTRHRYTRGELREKVSAAGFEMEKITYRNTLLFPLALIQRVVKKILSGGGREARSDLKVPSPLVNNFLTRVLSLENSLIRHMNIPFGLSVFCVARKR
jgi:SAM-dependent methyltransferase